jgi:hypothetical protein
LKNPVYFSFENIYFAKEAFNGYDSQFDLRLASRIAGIRKVLSISTLIRVTERNPGGTQRRYNTTVRTVQWHVLLLLSTGET